MKRLELTIPAGLVMGLGTIAAGLIFEGLNPRFLWQPTAALVVLGGTLSALTVRCGFAELGAAMRAALSLFRKETIDDDEEMIARLAWLVRSARREGFRVLENYANSTDDALVQRGLSLVADYAEPNLVRASLDDALDQETHAGRRLTALFESAAGYAPTFGILGAVLGLISVLRSLDNPGSLGSGIATAFVATIYGIALANLLFLPLAGRLRQRHETRMLRREALADALVAISAHEPPARIVRRFSDRGR